MYCTYFNCIAELFTHRGLDPWTHRGGADHEEPTAQSVAQVRIREKEYPPETERLDKTVSMIFES